jgi:hypothetical protein
MRQPPDRQAQSFVQVEQLPPELVLAQLLPEVVQLAWQGRQNHRRLKRTRPQKQLMPVKDKSSVS